MRILNYTINSTIRILNGTMPIRYDPATINISGYELSPSCYNTMAELKFHYFNFEFSRVLAYMYGIMILNYIFHRSGISIIKWMCKKEILLWDYTEARMIELYDHICVNANRFMLLAFTLLLLKYIFFTTV